MEEKNELTVVLENGDEKKAEILSTFKIEEDEYVIYSIDNDEETANLYAAQLIETEEGTKDLKDITDPDVKKQITKIIGDIVNN